MRSPISRVRSVTPSADRTLRAPALQFSLAGADIRLGGARIDLGEQVAHRDLVADRHVQALELARDLRADIDMAARLERAEGGDLVERVAARDRGGRRRAFAAVLGGDGPVQRHDHRGEGHEGKDRRARAGEGASGPYGNG
jgi:hypothetical protein